METISNEVISLDIANATVTHRTAAILENLNDFWVYVRESSDGFLFGYTRTADEASILRKEYQKVTRTGYITLSREGNYHNNDFDNVGELTIT